MDKLINQKTLPIIIGAILPISGLFLATLFPKQMVLEFAAILLGVIAAIYIGFGISDGRAPIKWVEILAATGFIFLALLGLWVNPWLLFIGYIGHGIWDWFHHTAHIQTKVASWYPPFCAVVDVVLGVGLLFWII